MRPIFIQKFLLVACLGILAVLLSASGAAAQKQDPRWFGPFQLSTEDDSVLGRAVSVADPFGFAHVFWAERDSQDERYVIQYARFDGTTWTNPIDIFLSTPEATIGFLFEPVITPGGNIHLFWTPNEFGPILQMTAPAGSALTARNWRRHPPIEIAAFKGSAAVDSNGVIHLMATNLFGTNGGLFYTSSDENGLNFSSPRWLDPDIPLNHGASTVWLRRDATNGTMHVVWRYEEKFPNGTLNGKQINYMRSTDGGANWIDYRLIDFADEEPSELRADGLLLAAHENQVHVIWSGVSSTHREHLYSVDSGETWKGPLRVFGDLHGGAGDTIVVDGIGDFHFMGQIRHPQALYDITWDGNKWGFPGLIYLITSVVDQIHIHNVSTVVRRGNQLISVFTNSPAEPQVILYAMHRNLENILPDEVQPTPDPTATPTPFVTPTVEIPEGSPTPTLVPFSNLAPSSGFNPGVDLSVSIAAVLLVMVVVVILRLAASRRR